LKINFGQPLGAYLIYTAALFAVPLVMGPSMTRLEANDIGLQCRCMAIENVVIIVSS